MVFYLWYLLIFPWFWDHVTSEVEDSAVAYMYLHGWAVEFPNSKIQKDRLGKPDINNHRPFMYFIVCRLFLMISYLHVERFAFNFPQEGKSAPVARIPYLLKWI